MTTKSIIVAISANAAYNWAMARRWNCEQRNIPEFQTKDGTPVSFIPDGKLFFTGNKRYGEIRVKGDEVEIYLATNWKQRTDAKAIKEAIENEIIKCVE